MRIVNQTRYNTGHIRRLFELCMRRVREDYRADWDKTRNLKVTIVYARRKSFISGHASYPRPGRTVFRPYMKLCIPFEWRADIYKTALVGYENWDITQALAATFIHELGHNLGVLRHVNQSTIEHQYREWIQANVKYEWFQIDEPTEKKPKPDVRLERYERALANMARATTRFKRAKTLLQKWTAKVRYYEKAIPQAAKRNT